MKLKKITHEIEHIEGEKVKIQNLQKVAIRASAMICDYGIAKLT
jgi:hypothetical protein